MRRTLANENHGPRTQATIARRSDTQHTRRVADHVALAAALRLSLETAQKQRSVGHIQEEKHHKSRMQMADRLKTHCESLN